jgi:hypothetical protein
MSKIEKVVDEVFDWISLVIIEIVTSFIAIILFIIGFVIIKNHTFIGIICILTGILFIIIFIKAVKIYVRGKNGK